MIGMNALGLALLLALGLGCLVAALVLSLWSRQATRDTLLVQRFSGRLRQASVETEGVDQVMLRRDPQQSYWGGLRDDIFPSDLSEQASKLFLLGFTCAVGMVGFVLTIVLRLNLIFALAIALVLALGVSFFVTRVRRRKRIASIEEALPEALDMIVRALRVGLPITAAVQTAGRDLIGPISQEFSITTTRISYGQDPISAFRDMARRCHNQSLHFFAAAVALQMSTGGNLADVIERLAFIARGRQQMKRKIKSITAEAKWSGTFLSAFPLLAVAMILSINPQYFSSISGQSFFYPMLGVVGVLLVINVLFMRWLVKLE